MTRAWVTALVVLALVEAAPAAAQAEGYPTELWSEYPLAPEVDQRITPSIGPLLPPSNAESAPSSGDAAPWALWALAAAVGVVALLVATRLTRPAGRGVRPAPARLRPQGSPRPSRGRPLAQYAPSPSLVLADAPEEPRRSVIKRTGLLRSRYVVLETESSGDQREVVESGSFWNVGGAVTRERLAEDAWDELVNDLRASGWEPDPTRRSDFYVLLQPVEQDDMSIVPTLEAYSRTDDDEVDET